MSGDITAGELLEILADEEMIESGYDREGMVALILLCRAGLQVLCGQIDGLQQELAELRAERDAMHLIGGMWKQGGAEPCGYVTTVDGEPVPLQVDASPVVGEALRRQAAAVIRRVELSDPSGPELGAVLALVPEAWDLSVVVRRATWEHDLGAQPACTAIGETREAAIMAATRELLGLDDEALRRRISGSPADVLRAAMALVDEIRTGDEGYGASPGRKEQALIDAVERLRAAPAEARETCCTCYHWQRDAEPATEAGARPCGLDTEPEPCPRHPGSGCAFPGRYRPRDEATAETDPAPSSGVRS